MDILAVKGNQELVSERITQKVREVIKHRNARKRTLKRVKNTEKRLESNRKRLSFSAGGNDSTSFNKERCSANSSGVIVANNQEIYGFPTLPKVSQFKIPKKVALSKDSSATSPISRSDKEKKCSPLKLLSHPLVLKNVKHLTKQSKLQNADSS